jgi:hypothetical protein
MNEDARHEAYVDPNFHPHCLNEDTLRKTYVDPKKGPLNKILFYRHMLIISIRYYISQRCTGSSAHRLRFILRIQVDVNDGTC